MSTPDGSSHPGSIGRPGDPTAVRLALGLCRLLARGHSSRFRSRYGASLLQNTRDLLLRSHRRGGAPAVVLLLPRLIRDLLFGGLAERVRPSRIPSPQTPSMLDNLLQDLRFARRSMARRPTLTALAVLTLALGIGASVSMFSVIDAVMLRPLPYPDPERIVSVYTTIPEWRDIASLSAARQRTKWSYDEFVEYHRLQTSFSELALHETTGGNLTGLGQAARIPIGLASLELLPMLGAVPLKGRLFAREDIEQEAAVVILTHGFWQERMGGAESAIGERIVLDGDPYSVVGILPEGFEVDGSSARVWLPIFENVPFGYFPGNTGSMDHVLRAMGRLRAGVTPAMAADEASRLLPEIGGEDHFTQHGANVVPRLLDRTRRVRGPLWVLMGAVLLLLLVACANVATFLLGQAIDRQQEIAVRGALGAGGPRILRQLLTESLLLAIVGGGLGLLIAAQGIQALTALAPANLPRLEFVSLDLRAAGFALGASAVAGVLFGLAPALSLATSDLARTLGSARSGSSGRSRLQAAMVIAEVAVATVLLVGAGLVVRSFLELNAVDPGFRTEGLIRVSVSPDRTPFYDDEGRFAAPAMAAYYDELEQILARVPGVDEVTLAEVVPFTGAQANNNVVAVGQEEGELEQFIAGRRFIDPDYHRVMGIPLLAGRYLTADDDRPDATPVVVISKNLANGLFGRTDVVGERILWWERETEVVGVVDDVRDRDLADTPEMMFYSPPAPIGQAGGTFVLRTEADTSEVAPSVRAALASFDPDLPVTVVEPLREMIADSLAEARYRARLIGVFAVLAAVLSILGLYGVAARAVRGRTREIGIRVALGAEANRVISLVLKDGVRLAAVGAGVGLAASLAATRFLESYLYGVRPNDPLTLLLIVLLVTSMAIGASFVPSLRASRVNPVTALREE